jgi:hypothetical protein
MNRLIQSETAEIEAELVFLRPMEGRPVIYQYEPPPGVPARTGEYDAHRIRIRDGRPIADRLSLDVEGFVLVRAPTAVRDFADDAQVRAAYYPKVERIIAAATGAQLAVNFDHTIRNAARAESGEAGIRPPVGRAHNDFTLRSGPERARKELEVRGLDAGKLLRHRFAIVNLWRPIGNVVERWPLALCDARTIEPADLVTTDLVYPDRIGEIHAMQANKGQRWFYFPRVTPDEAILIKVYDSSDQVARFTAHGAFDDPASPPDAPERESIEARALVIYPG